MQLSGLPRPSAPRASATCAACSRSKSSPPGWPASLRRAGWTGGGALPVSTSRKVGPKRSSLTAPTPVMPASASRVCGRRGRHLDQRAVGEDDVGGHAGGVGERAALRLQRGEQALVLLGDQRRRRGARRRRAAAWRTLSARSSSAASPRSSGRAASVRRSAPWRLGSGRTQVEAHELAEDRLPLGLRAVRRRRRRSAAGRGRGAAPSRCARRAGWRSGARRRSSRRCAGSPRRPCARPRWRRRASGRSRQRSQLPQGSARVSPK